MPHIDDPHIDRLQRELEAKFQDSYEDVEFIAEGGFGAVFKAKRRSDGKLFAIKMVDRKKDHSLRVMEEINTLEKLRKHSVVVRIEAYKKTDDYVFIVMEYCEGGSLRKYIMGRIDNKENPMSEKIAAVIFQQVCSAVASLHNLKIIHRDLTTNNILLKKKITTSNPDWIKIKLCDFGLVANQKTHGPAKTVAGTPGFMDPEVRNGIYAQEVDFYSLGCILFSMLAGEDPPRDGRLNVEGRTDFSRNARDLITRLIKKKFRTIKEVEDHEFCRQNAHPTSSVLPSRTEGSCERSKSRDEILRRIRMKDSNVPEKDPTKERPRIGRKVEFLREFRAKRSNSPQPTEDPPPKPAQPEPRRRLEPRRSQSIITPNPTVAKSLPNPPRRELSRQRRGSSSDRPRTAPVEPPSASKTTYYVEIKNPVGFPEGSKFFLMTNNIMRLHYPKNKQVTTDKIIYDVKRKEFERFEGDQSEGYMVAAKNLRYMLFSRNQKEILRSDQRSQWVDAASGGGE
ncbi:hypothetical protein L596_024904 [Steinernema carpocapsae]|uniref:Protein kinase domain-containing protein n=1 Tax=Steinernema carpocapsae TaxID=34508 RepID=A0A4U5M6B2_STECR|nr:hypothetical protein L596_024904 [Steinernema carpocapsae]